MAENENESPQDGGLEPQTPTLTPEQMADALRRARQEAADRRTKARELEEKLAGYEAKERELAEAEAKRRGEFDELEKQYKSDLESERRARGQDRRAFKDRLVNAELRTHLADAIDPEVVALAIDRKGIEVDDDYAISGISEAVAALREAKPHLFRAGDPTPRGTNNNGLGPVGNKPSAPTDWAAATDTPLEQLVAQHRASL